MSDSDRVKAVEEALGLGGSGGCRVSRTYLYLQMGMLVVEEEWEREVSGGGGIPVLKEV